MEKYASCLEKQQRVKELFARCQGAEEKYEKIIELGQSLPSLPAEYKSEANRVQGCQSLLYLRSEVNEGKILFTVDSDALISKGLAYLLMAVYSGEEPEVILKCPPTFLDALEIPSSLTPNRANGLYSLHLRMKQEALKVLVGKERGNL